MEADSLKTPHSLIERLGGHGPDWNGAWSEFFALYGGWVHSLALRCTLRHHEANDVVQETMTELFRVLPLGRYRPEQGKFRGFLSGVVRCNISRALGRRHRAENRCHSLHAGALESGGWETSLADERPRPDEEFEHAVKLALIDQALRALVTHRWVTPQRVEIFVALTVHGKAPAELAAELGLERNNIDAAKHAVKTKLQQMIRCLEEGIDPRDYRP